MIFILRRNTNQINKENNALLDNKCCQVNTRKLFQFNNKPDI